MTDYTKEADVLKVSILLSKYHMEVGSVEGIGEKGAIQLKNAKEILEFSRQQSAAEIDRLRGLIKVAHDTGYFNGASYIEESKWEESWQQFKTENNIQ